jgi:hypothetical protein
LAARVQPAGRGMGPPCAPYTPAPHIPDAVWKNFRRGPGRVTEQRAWCTVARGRVRDDGSRVRDNGGLRNHPLFRPLLNRAGFDRTGTANHRRPRASRTAEKGKHKKMRVRSVRDGIHGPHTPLRTPPRKQAITVDAVASQQRARTTRADDDLCWDHESGPDQSVVDTSPPPPDHALQRVVAWWLVAAADHVKTTAPVGQEPYCTIWKGVFPALI